MTTMNINEMTLKNLQSIPGYELESMSFQSDNRFYSLACSLMASAQEAYALGNVELALAYGRKAATNLLRAKETEFGRVRRCERTAVVISERV